MIKMKVCKTCQEATNNFSLQLLDCMVTNCTCKCHIDKKTKKKTKLIKTKEKCPRCNKKMKAKVTRHGTSLRCKQCGFSK